MERSSLNPWDRGLASGWKRSIAEFAWQENPKHEYRIDKCSLLATDWIMRIIRKTEVFGKWLDGLKDIRARARILVRIQRLEAGNAGNVKPEDPL